MKQKIYPFGELKIAKQYLIHIFFFAFEHWNTRTLKNVD